MSNEDQFDLTIDFFQSDEWLLPIASFIDYYCIIFSTNNTEEDKPEKMKVFTDYRTTVNANLNEFLHEILNINRDGLTSLLTMFEDEIDYKDLQYLLAAEDYFIFHDFMFEANNDKNRKAAHSKMKKPTPSKQVTKGETEEERMMRLAIEASLADDQKKKFS